MNSPGLCFCRRAAPATVELASTQSRRFQTPVRVLERSFMPGQEDVLHPISMGREHLAVAHLAIKQRTETVPMGVIAMFQVFPPLRNRFFKMCDAIQNRLRLRVHATPSANDAPSAVRPIPADNHPPLGFARCQWREKLGRSGFRIPNLPLHPSMQKPYSNIKSNGYGTRWGAAVSQRMPKANSASRVYFSAPTP
jgi:hypothetical protein